MLWFGGNYGVLPFLVLYVQDLGDLDVTAAALWAGLILTASPLTSAIFQPLWGALADRFGRKLLLQRSLIGFAVALGLMAVATEVWQLLVIRLCMGVFGGFTGLSVAMVSDRPGSAATTRAIGRLNAARVIGMGIGPLIGGGLAVLGGYRFSCGAASLLAVMALFAVSVLVARDGRPAGSMPAAKGGWRDFFGAEFVVLLAATSSVRLIERTFDPVIPLMLAEFGTGPDPATGAAVIGSAGLFVTAVASAAAVWLTFGMSYRTALTAALILGAPCLAGIAVTTGWWQILILRVLAGVFLGIAVTLGYALVAQRVPPSSHGLAYGVVGSATSYGTAAGSLVAGALAAVSLTAVFIFDAVILVAVGLAVVVIARRPRSAK